MHGEDGLARLDAQNELNALRANEAEVAAAQATLTQAKNNESRLRRNSAPTEQNLSNSGYLLRGWLSVRKLAEVKERVLDKR